MRHATPDDIGDFHRLWWEYLLEREKGGSIVPAMPATMDFFVALWRSVVEGRTDGLSLIVPGAAVSLWGPAAPFPVLGGPMMTGQGTYVRPEFRRGGLGAAMYERGFAELRARGYRLFAGSVDTGNLLGERNAERLNSRVIQVTRVVEL